MDETRPKIDSAGCCRDLVTRSRDMHRQRQWGKYDEVLKRIHVGTIGPMCPGLLEGVVTGQGVDENLPANSGYAQDGIWDKQ